MSKKKTIYYFECDFGCGLESHYGIAQARKEIAKSVGTSNGLSVVRKATSDEIAWVESMGGHVPKEASR